MTAAPSPPPAALPQFPKFLLPYTNETDCTYALEHMILLATPQQRVKITGTGVVATAEDLLYIDKASLLNLMKTNTTITLKMNLKALKR